MRQPRGRRQPVFAVDKDGEEVVLITLANHASPAKLLRSDFEKLTADGWSDQWTLNASGRGIPYVRCRGRGGDSLQTVARLVAGARNRQAVRYIDGDRLNLRSDNLWTSKGHGKVNPKAQAATQ